MKKLISFFVNQKLFTILFILLLLTIIIKYIIDTFLLTNDIYQELFNHLAPERINDILIIVRRFEFLSYVFLCVLLIIKCSVISIIILIGLFLANIKLDYVPVFKTILVCEFIFLLPNIIRVIWFTFFKLNYSYDELQSFYPLSILNFLDINHIDKIWIYPLQLLNVFEITYWIALAYGISKLINNNFDKALKIILSSYIPALVVWVVFVMFLTVTLNLA